MPGLSEIENGASINELTSKAAEAEKTDPSSAIEIYNGILKTHPLQIHAYDRLMVIYRQEKNYKKELPLLIPESKRLRNFIKNNPADGLKKSARSAKN